jgi:hypothetical protein
LVDILDLHSTHKTEAKLGVIRTRAPIDDDIGKLRVVSSFYDVDIIL